MMIKKLVAVFCLGSILLAAGGCRLAKENSAPEGEDRLIGVFITTEHLDLFNVEGYINDHFNGGLTGGEMTIDGDNSRYNERLYATVTAPGGASDERMEPGDYVFEGVEGIRYFIVSMPGTETTDSYFASIGDEGISDGHTDIKVGDEGESLILEGTIYVAPDIGGHAFFVNPVYQDENGEIYVTSGTGSSSSGIQTEGTSFSQNLEASYINTENGKTMTDAISITVTVSIKNVPEKLVILQMDANHNVMARDEYDPGAVPKSMTPHEDVSYIILESYNVDADGNIQVKRDLCGKDEAYLRSYHSREDGIIIGQDTKLNWQ